MSCPDASDSVAIVSVTVSDASEEVARHHAVPGLGDRVEVPLPVAGEARDVHAALEEEAGLLRDLAGFGGEFGERVLETVVHLREHSGTELGCEQLSGELDAVVDHEVRRRVEHLHVAPCAAHADDFRHELLVSANRVSDLVLRDGSVECDRYHVAVYGYDLTCGCHGG